MPFKKLIKYILIALGLIIALIFSVQIILIHYLNSSIRTEIESQIAKKSDGSYRLTIEKLSANLLTRSITAAGVRLLPNIKSKDSTEALYYFTVTQISLNSFKLLPLLQHKLITDKMEIENPTIAIYRSNHKDTVSRDQSRKFTLYKLIQKNLQLLFIATIEIKNADIKIYDHVDDLKPTLSSNNNSITVIDFKIDKTVDEQGRFFIANKAGLVMNNFSYITKDSLYVMKVKRLSASYTDSLICLDEVKVQPNFSKKDFGDVVGRQVTRIKVSILKSCLNKMDLKQFFEHGWMIAKSVELDSLNIEAFRDKNDEFRNPVAKSMQQIIRDIPFFIAIDSVKVNGGFIAYEELAEDAKYKGKVIFTNVNSVITGLCNDTLFNKSEKYLVVNSTADFMNKGKLEARYSFPLSTNKTVFDCRGKIFKLPLNSLNIIMEPSANVSIKEGTVDSMLFAFTADETKSNGKMTLTYHNLKIEFLNNDLENRGFMEKIKTAFAHKFVIKENNPSGNDAIREGEINFPYDPNRFIFYYSWKSLLSGIKSTMGLNSPGKKAN